MFNINSGYGHAVANRFTPAAPTGKVFLVGKTSVANRNIAEQIFGGDPDGVLRLHATIAAALDKCTANAGDVIYVLPGHTETLTAALELDVAGVAVIGLGTGSIKPALTGNGTIDAVSITAANVIFDNFHFPAPETDNQTAAINVAATGDYAIVRNITGVGSQTAKNVVDMITIVAGANGVTLENIDFYNTTVAVNSFLNIEGAVADLTIKNFRAVGEVTTGGIIDGGAVTNLHLEDVVVVVTGTTKPAITLDSNPSGYALNVRAKGTSTTIATNCNLGNALALFEIRVAEEFSVQGGIIPAQDTE